MNVRKVWSIAARVITWILIAFTVTMLAFTIITLAMGKQESSLFGRRAFIVLSDSMSDTFQAGDLVVCKEVDPATVVEGDIISFVCMDETNDAYGEVITHKVREKYVEDQVLYFTTYGTTTGVDDKEPVASNFVMGKYSFHVPKVGNFIEWMRTPVGYVLVIGLPFGILIASQAVNCVRAWRKYKEFERAEIEGEREQIASEREQMSRMMEELQRMREQLAGQVPQPPAAEQSPAPPADPLPEAQEIGTTAAPEQNPEQSEN